MNSFLQNKLVNLFFCVLLIAIVFIYGFYKLSLNPYPLPLNPIKISIIQGNIPQTLKWDESYKQNIIDTYFNLTRQAAAERPDLIIWPETSFPVDFESEPELVDGLFGLAKEVNAHLLIGANRFSGNKIYNSAFLVSPEGRIKQYYDKLHLVPFGEYMPKFPNFLYKIFPEKINMVGDFSPGEEYTVFNVGAGRDLPLHFSTLICFEDVFPELSHRFVKNGARLLVNITNDGWYGLSSAPFQHAQASVFRAVENRVSVVRAANTGYSVFIDESGRITGKIEPFTAGHRTEVCKIKS